MTGTPFDVHLTSARDVDRALDDIQRARQPGASPVAAPSASEPTVGLAAVFYPGVVDPDAAQHITLGLAEERDGFDIQLQLVPTAHVEGTIVSPTGRFPARMTVSLVPSSATAGTPLRSGSLSARVTPDGSFVFNSVEPGQYTLSARASTVSTPDPPPPARPGGPPQAPARIVTALELWATADVTVRGQDIKGIVLQLQPGMTIDGRVAFDGELPPPDDLSRMRVTLAPLASGNVAPSVPTTESHRDGTFHASGVMPGQYRVATLAPRGWYLRSALLGGRDVLDTGLDVSAGQNIAGLVLHYSDRTTTLTGTIADALGRPAPDYFLFAFSTDRSAWSPPSRRVSSLVRPRPDGRYEIINLPPGEYYLCAIEDIQNLDRYDPQVLESLTTASVKVTLAEGGTTRQNVRLAGGGRPFP